MISITRFCINAPVRLDGFWPFTLTYDLAYDMLYRCEEGYVDGSSFCWLPPAADPSSSEYKAAKLMAYQEGLKEAAAWQKVNNAKTSTIESLSVHGFDNTTDNNQASLNNNSFSDISASIVMSINMLGTYIKAEIPEMAVRIYLTTQYIDPFAAKFSNRSFLADNAAIFVDVKPFTYVGLPNGGPFNISALATVADPNDTHRVKVLREAIGSFASGDTMYLYVQGASDPIADKSFIRRVFSLMPPWRIQINGTSSDSSALASTVSVAEGSLESQCQQARETSFQVKGVDFIVLDGNNLQMYVAVFLLLVWSCQWVVMFTIQSARSPLDLLKYRRAITNLVLSSIFLYLMEIMQLMPLDLCSLSTT